MSYNPNNWQEGFDKTSLFHKAWIVVVLTLSAALSMTIYGVLVLVSIVIRYWWVTIPTVIALIALNRTTT